jgi:hypothetical protein
MLEEDYDLLGYTVLQMNSKDGSLVYGTYYLQFFEGPIFVEELDPNKSINSVVKLTLRPAHIDLNQEERFNPQRNQNLKYVYCSLFSLVKHDYQSYVVQRDDENELDVQNIKTPQDVGTQHRINKGGDRNEEPFNFAEFAKALGSKGKF